MLACGISSDSDGLKIGALPTPNLPCAPGTLVVWQSVFLVQKGRACSVWGQGLFLVWGAEPVPPAGGLGSLERTAQGVLPHAVVPDGQPGHSNPARSLLLTCSLVQATPSPVPLGPCPSLSFVPSRFIAGFLSSRCASLC